MRLFEATTHEINRLDRARTAVVVPFAAVEQHGPHLPVGTDTIITQALGERLEKRIPDRVLLLPVELFGSSPHHLVFSGTLSLTSRTFLEVAWELADSLARHGFHHFLLLNGHGGNQALLNVAVQEIRLKRPELKIAHATYWTVAAEEFARIRESKEGGMGHACEMETSILLALRPELVRRELAEPGGDPPRSAWDHHDMLRPALVGQFRFWSEMTRNGVLGDPTLAKAAKGERFLEAAVRALEGIAAALLEGKIG